ncbi:MAG: flagellar hook-basal body complex protein, partial [Pseudomonadota bacterium]
MTISSSLNAGVMGLSVNATRLATISDNIANSATYGYKRADVDFSSLVINQRPSVYSAGGVRGTAIRNVSDPGSLISTGRATDLAVNGTGMLPVTTLNGLTQPAAERDFEMLPTGSFSPDADGIMRTDSGLVLLGWPVDADGDAIVASRGTTTGLEPVNINNGVYSAEVTTRIAMGVNLPGDPSQLPASNTLEFPIEYYDEIGLPQSLDVSFVRNAGGDWTATINDNSTGAAVQALSFGLTFNSDGTVDTVTPGGGAAYDPLEGTINMTLPSGPVELFVGRPDTTQGLAQVGLAFQTQNVDVNGSPAGELQSIEISADGSLEAIYNSGARRTLFKIPVAVVSNPNGLLAVDNQSFQVTRESGGIYLWDAGSGPAGDVVGYALMESNTDIATELTNLIETQRAYSSNAKIVQTVDEM